MDYRIRQVVILGGGTAGWMTAAYLAKALGPETGVTVLEAPAIPRIGVGEATVPNLHRTFFHFLGLAEDEWMRACNASFKMGVRFVNWRTPGAGESRARALANGPDHFDHLFGLLRNHEQVPLSHYWAYRRREGLTDEPFDYACYRESPILDAKLAPRKRSGDQWTNYAWHFDAQQVADYLRDVAVDRFGVHHVQGRMTGVLFDERGFLTGLRTEEGPVISGDFFVDCSGFRGLLINEAMGEPFLDMSDHLINDRAVATAVPHDDAAHGVEPYTSAIAMPSGWTWKIPMLGRFGTGYVYSSRFASQDDATLEFCRLWGLDPERQHLNHVRFRVGRNRRAWVRNCASIGLSSCFLEPLESSGIYFITAAIYQLAKHFPDKRFDPVLTDRFNREIETMFDDTRDFIQAHFALAPRTDTPFWRANKELTLADDIREKIAMYRAGMAVNMPTTTEDNYYDNFDAEFRNFWTNGSYYCVFAGLDFLPDHPMPALTYRPDAVHAADPMFADIKRGQQELLAELPSTYEYLCHLHGRELAGVN
jgi:tryptophan halogenase